MNHDILLGILLSVWVVVGCFQIAAALTRIAANNAERVYWESEDSEDEEELEWWQKEPK